MYKIKSKLAVHGFDWNWKTMNAVRTYEHQYDSDNYGVITRPEHDKTGDFIDAYNTMWVVVDCRSLLDDWFNPVEKYRDLILRGIEYLRNAEHVVCCCSAGQSRSNSIALGILVQYYKMDFYDAWELIKSKNPVCNIAIQHIDAIKSLYNVTLP